MARTMLAEKEQDNPHAHAFADRSNRYPLDAAIRKLGYQIYERKKGKEVLWCKHSAMARAAADVTGNYVGAQNSMVYYTQGQIVKRYEDEIEKMLEEWGC